jgi:beta-lactamase regulating signal transducer with metallopeptidase domain
VTLLGALGWVVVHASWQAGIVAGVLALFLHLGRAPAWLRYASAFGALLFIAALPVVTAIVLATVDVDASAASAPASGGGAPAPAKLLFLVGTSLAAGTKWVAVAWLAGVVVLLVRWGGGWWLVARLTSRDARPARPAWAAALRSAAERMGVTSPVELLESTSVDTPTVIGHRRPVVLLPVPAFETLATAEAESVLAHELAHVRRGDFVANGVQTLVEILFFFHPAVRWLSRRVRDERELCCDDIAVAAIGSRVVYARALAQLEQLRLSFRAARIALGATGGTLLRRILRLADDTDQRMQGSVTPQVTLTLAIAVTLMCVAMVSSVVLPPTIHAQAAAQPAADRYTVRAHDPAGEFTITFEHGRPTRATVDGIAVARERLVSRGDSLFLPWGRTRYFAVHLKPDGFTWTPRTP